MPRSAPAGLRIVHAIHDFLPRHRAGSEIYALDLCRELDRRHHVTMLAAEYDLARAHGHITWRVQDGLPVVEIVNNWRADSFEQTYRASAITEQLARVLDVVQPDILHVHSLLNLSFDLPQLARSRGIPVAATLHDYSLVCASGGQRLHRTDDHLCDTIDADRCARCFRESPFYTQIGVGNLARGGLAAPLKRAAGVMLQQAPAVARLVAGAVGRSAGIAVEASDIEARLVRAHRVFDDVDVFVAPSQSMADAFVRFGIPSAKLRVLDYGFAPIARSNGSSTHNAVRVGYVGSLVWHKGVHVLVDAVRALPPQAYELRIFGDRAVAPDYVADLERRAAGLPVRFMGAVDRDRIADAYGGVDVLVVPSLWPENSPLVVREAFMAGKPVVAARIGGLGDLVVHDVNGLLYEPRSTAALTEALRSLLGDPSRLDALARGIPAVKSIAVHSREWETIYTDLLGRA